MATKVVRREADVNTKVLDKGLKNIWKWEWLEKKVNDEPVRRFIRKLSSFNEMNDIIDNKSGRINIDTYNAIQNVKFGIRASATSSIEFFRKKDYLHDRVNPLLVKNMRTSYKQYKCILEKRKTVTEEKKDKLKVKTDLVVTKRKAKELYAKAAKKARISHSTFAAKKKK